MSSRLEDNTHLNQSFTPTSPYVMSSSDKTGKVKRLIIIENETMLRDLLVEVLQSYPQCKLIGTYGDGAQGWAAVSEQKPDLVFLDVKVPSLNGMEILRNIKAELHDTRVFVCSSYFSAETIRQALKSGADVILEKTSGLDELHKAIKKILNDETYMGPGVVKVLREIMLNPEQDRSLDSLTPREREVLQLIAEGNSSKVIATKLDITTKTAEAHRSNLMKKLGVHGVAGLTRYAISHGLIGEELDYV